MSMLTRGRFPQRRQRFVATSAWTAFAPYSLGKRAQIERALGAEPGHHLGDPSGTAKPEAVSNQRNGSTGKTVLTEDGPLRIDVPRERDASFKPLLIPKHERRFTGFDDKIVAMYARGMTVREVQGFLADQYGVDVSPEFISSVTDAVMVEIGAWQARPLEPIYPVVFFEALRVKIRADAVVRDKAIYLALGVLADGTRDILESPQALEFVPVDVAKLILGEAVHEDIVAGSHRLGACDESCQAGNEDLVWLASAAAMSAIRLACKQGRHQRPGGQRATNQCDWNDAARRACVSRPSRST